MKKITKAGLPCYQFHLIGGFSGDLDHAVFTRAGGVSRAPFDSLNVRYGIGDRARNVKENRRRILKALNLERLLSADQIHSKNVLTIDERMARQLFIQNPDVLEIADIDGFVTNQKGLGLMIQVADCQAMLFYDPVNKILGVAHAGWKGLKQNISAAVVNEMLNLGARTENILVGISPSLGPKHSEFSDPLIELGPAFEHFIKGRQVDFWEFSRNQLIRMGIDERKIEIARLDTADPETGSHFYSYRRENKKTGRFALVAALK